MEKNQVISWQKHLQHQQASKVSVAKYCQEQGLTVHQFHYWKRKFRGLTQNQPAFLEVIPKTQIQEADTEIIISLEIGEYKLFRFGIKINGLQNKRNTGLWGQQ